VCVPLAPFASATGAAAHLFCLPHTFKEKQKRPNTTDRMDVALIAVIGTQKERENVH